MAPGTSNRRVLKEGEKVEEELALILLHSFFCFFAQTFVQVGETCPIHPTSLLEFRYLHNNYVSRSVNLIPLSPSLCVPGGKKKKEPLSTTENLPGRVSKKRLSSPCCAISPLNHPGVICAQKHDKRKGKKQFQIHRSGKTNVVDTKEN